jgi:flagellar protein FliS
LTSGIEAAGTDTMYSPNQGIRSYQQVGAAAQVAAAEDPVKLIQLLLTNSVERLALARGHMERGETAPKAEQLSRAVAIVDTLSGLVDVEKGGEIATNLRGLYEYATQRLTYANLKNDTKALDEAAGVLREIKAGWDGIVGQPRPATAGQP